MELLGPGNRRFPAAQIASGDPNTKIISAANIDTIVAENGPPSTLNIKTTGGFFREWMRVTALVFLGYLIYQTYVTK